MRSRQGVQFPRSEQRPAPPVGWKPRVELAMKDHSSAANRGFKNIADLFADCRCTDADLALDRLAKLSLEDAKPLKIGMCGVHVRMNLDRHTDWFDDADSIEACKTDLTALNEEVSRAELAAHAFELMMQKWEHKYKEPRAAREFRKQWGKELFTRAAMNCYGTGGIPPDNNALEGKNGGMKGDFQHNRSLLPSSFFPLCPSLTLLSAGTASRSSCPSSPAGSSMSLWPTSASAARFSLPLLPGFSSFPAACFPAFHC